MSTRIYIFFGGVTIYTLYTSDRIQGSIEGILYSVGLTPNHFAHFPHLLWCQSVAACHVALGATGHNVAVLIPLFIVQPIQLDATPKQICATVGTRFGC